MSALIQTSFANEATAYWATEDQLISLSQAVANLSVDVQIWSTYPAVSTINVSSNAITNVSSLQIDAQVLTANASSLFINGVAVATIPDISNVEDWAFYPSLANIDANNFAISNVSGFELDGNQVSTLGNTILVNGLNPTSNWSSYTAGTNVNMGGLSISNVFRVSISGTTQDVVLTASGTQLLVDGSPVYTGALPSSDVSLWANYPAVADVNMSGFAISNTPSISISGTTQNVVLTALASALLVDGQPVYTGPLPPSTTSNWSLFPALSDVNMSGQNILGNGDISIVANNITLNSGSNITLTKKATTKGIDMTGVLTQCNVGGGSNYFESAVQMGNSGALPTDNLGTLAIYGGNVPVGLSTFYVKGGCTLDGNLTKGHTIGCLPALGINTQRIDVLPVGILLTTPTFITMNGLGAANIAMGGAVAIAAGSYVTLEAGTGLGQNGIFVQNTARDSNARLVMTGGGTLYNATEVQASNIVNPLGVRFYNGVYNPSGGSIIVPAVYGRAIVDPSTATAYLANLTGGDLPATKNSNSVFVGSFPSLTTNGATATIAIGSTTGMSGQAAGAIAIGEDAGSNSQGVEAIAIGSSAGGSSQGTNGVAIGNTAGFVSQRANAIAIGTNAGYSGQLSNSVVIGAGAGSNGCGAESIAIGTNAGGSNHGTWAVAIGSNAGASNQGNGAIAIGLQVGLAGQSVNAVAIGNVAGYSNQGQYAVAIGLETGQYNQGANSVAIGWEAGQSNQRSNAVAIGYQAGLSGQLAESICIGTNAGQSNHGQWAIAIGSNAGQSNQGNGAVAIGLQCGLFSQSVNATAVGNVAGYSNQGQYAVAIGLETGQFSQGANAVAIGWEAGQNNQGSNSIAIGYVASQTGGSFSNTIVVNATGVALNPAQANSTYIAPMRGIQSSNAYQNSLMSYNTTTKEVGYATNAYSIQVLATSATAIALDPTLRGKTYILTGTTTQAFTTTALGANDTNFFVVVHNGNGTGGGDINLTGMTGTTIVHERKVAQNGGIVYLYWNGTGLVGY